MQRPGANAAIIVIVRAQQIAAFHKNINCRIFPINAPSNNQTGV